MEASGSVKSTATCAPRSATAGSSEMGTASDAMPDSAPASWPIAVSPGAARAPLSLRSAASCSSGMIVRPMRPEAPSIATFNISGSLSKAAEEALHSVNPGFLARVMAFCILPQCLVEFLQQLLLLAVQVHRRLDHDATEEIAGRPTPNW